MLSKLDEDDMRDYIRSLEDNRFEAIFCPIVEMGMRDEESKGLYLNKYEVINLVRGIAEESEPMVSASYDYYRINAGTVLNEIDKLDVKKHSELLYTEDTGERFIKVLDGDNGYLKYDRKLSTYIVGNKCDGAGWYKVKFTKEDVGEKLYDLLSEEGANAD